VAHSIVYSRETTQELGREVFFVSSYSAPLAMIWSPHSESAPGELNPSCTPRYAPVCSKKLCNRCKCRTHLLVTSI